MSEGASVLWPSIKLWADWSLGGEGLDGTAMLPDADKFKDLPREVG